VTNQSELPAGVVSGFAANRRELSTGGVQALYTSQEPGMTPGTGRWVLSSSLVWFLPFGIPILALALAALIFGIVMLGRVSRRARQFGYSSRAAYLRAVPRTDAEKRDAVDFTLRGIVFCVLGVIFPPFVLIGLYGLFYGGRKLVYASMGLGLVDDSEQPGA
jgi:hypothetical protein